MKRTDIERMISLADDRYIDEIFQDKITGRRRNIFVTFTAVAAALALVAGGISHFVSTADKSNDITTDMPAVSMEDITDNTETEPKMQEVAYADFFKNKGDYPANFYIEWSSEFNGDKQMSFDETYVKTILPFSAEGYSRTRDQFYLYTDKNDIPFGASIYFESSFDENASPKFKSISVNVCDKGKFSYPFPIEEFEPINYMYTDIYGFDDIDNFNYSSGVYESALTAYFTAGGSEYSVSTRNLSAEETMHIVESLIQSGFSAKDFDLSMGGEFEHETLNINFDTANSIEPFAGFVPVVDGVLYLYNEEVIYDVMKINGEVYGQYMAVVYYDKTDDGDRVMLEYYTSGWGDRTPFDNTVRLSSIMQDSLNNFKVGDEYKFTLDCGEFMINVTAKCTSEQLWKYIDAIKGNAGNGIDEQDGVRLSNGINLVDSTLSAADKIKPFAGYIPQSESFGSLKLSAVSEGYFDGNASPCLIHMVYVDDFDNPKQMLTAHFYSDYKAVFLDEPKYSAVPLAELSAEKIKGLGKSFVLDCGDFEILIGASPECSEEDIWRFINGVKGLTTYDAGYDAEDEDEKILTMDKVRELAKKGDDLTWSDFDGYTFTEGGSGLYIKSYAVEGGYNLMIGGEGRETKPMYIKLSDGNGKIIDIRYDSIDDFLNQKMLTIDKIKELAEKGDDLMWDDFDGYLFSEGGSGLYIRMYPVEGGYTLAIGGVPNDKPMYINLGGNGKHIDVRYESIDEFLNEN